MSIKFFCQMLKPENSNNLLLLFSEYIIAIKPSVILLDHLAQNDTMLKEEKGYLYSD